MLDKTEKRHFHHLFRNEIGKWEWFDQVHKIEKSQSQTSLMLQSGLLKDRQKSRHSFNQKLHFAEKGGFVLSQHDNRKLIENFGEWLGTGSGRYKLKHSQSQHADFYQYQIFNKSTHKFTPTTPDIQDYQRGTATTHGRTFTSPDQKSYLHGDEAHRRFPKSHFVSIRLPTLPRTNTLVRDDDDELSPVIPTKVLAKTQVPRKKCRPWNYSYMLRSKSLYNQPAQAS